MAIPKSPTSGAGAPTAGAHTGVIGVFSRREQVEKAVEALGAVGVDRAQITLLRHGDNEGRPADQPLDTAGAEKPVDRAEQGNLTGILAGVPTYIGAVVAAGVAVASGGALAGVAIAAVGGAVAGGALGVGGAKLLKDSVDSTYEAELAQGGIILLVAPQSDEERAKTRETLTSLGATGVKDQQLSN